MPNDILVLAMHGAPPSDFPPDELAEFFGLHARLEQAGAERLPAPMRRRAEELEQRVRNWPRTADNDGFWVASHQLAGALAELTGLPVLVGFNEFCAPDLDAVFGTAAVQGAERVIVVTPMLTAGGEHAERDIPGAIARARSRHPGITFVYAWPYDMQAVARFLAQHVQDRLRP